MKKEGVLLISHGSRAPEALAEIQALAARLKKKTGCPVFECAFLELNEPDIRAGIGNCVRKGVTDLLVLLNFLNAGRHVLQDVPAEIEKAHRHYPGLRIQVGRHLSAHPSIDDFFLGMLQSLRRAGSGRRRLSSEGGKRDDQTQRRRQSS